MKGSVASYRNFEEGAHAKQFLRSEFQIQIEAPEAIMAISLEDRRENEEKRLDVQFSRLNFKIWKELRGARLRPFDLATQEYENEHGSCFG